MYPVVAKVIWFYDSGCCHVVLHNFSSSTALCRRLTKSSTNVIQNMNVTRQWWFTMVHHGSPRFSVRDGSTLFLWKSLWQCTSFSHFLSITVPWRVGEPLELENCPEMARHGHTGIVLGRTAMKHDETATVRQRSWEAAKLRPVSLVFRTWRLPLWLRRDLSRNVMHASTDYICHMALISIVFQQESNIWSMWIRWIHLMESQRGSQKSCNLSYHISHTHWRPVSCWSSCRTFMSVESGSLCSIADIVSCLDYLVQLPALSGLKGDALGACRQAAHGAFPSNDCEAQRNQRNQRRSWVEAPSECFLQTRHLDVTKSLYL